MSWRVLPGVRDEPWAIRGIAGTGDGPREAQQVALACSRRVFLEEIGPVLLPGSLPIVLHHLLRDIPLVTDRRCATGTTVRTASATPVACSISFVRTGAISPIAGYRFSNDSLLNFRVRFGGLLRLAPGGAESQNKSRETDCAFHGGSHCIANPPKKIWGGICKYAAPKDAPAFSRTFLTVPQFNTGKPHRRSKVASSRTRGPA